MPYIKQEDRLLFEPFLNDLFGCFNEKDFTPGDLNYLMTRLCHEFLVKNEMSYTNCNAVMGVFSSAANEFYRKVVVDYENDKAEKNGDVMPDFRNEA